MQCLFNRNLLCSVRYFNRKPFPTLFRQFSAPNKGKPVEKSSNHVVEIKGVTRKLEDGRLVLDNVNLTLLRGAKIGVLGPNGAGKSTLLKIISDDIEDEYEGEVSLNDVSVGYLPQEPELDSEKNVKENIFDGVPEEKKEILEDYVEAHKELEAYKESNNPDQTKLRELETTYNNLLKQVESHKLMDLSRKIEIAIAALRCPPGNASVTNLSGGEKRRVALCRLLISQPDVLLLDEPTNHLDAESVAWLEKYLKDYKGTLMAITHDRYFLDNITNWILEVDRGKLFPFKGNYTKWLGEKHKRLALETKQEANRVKQIEKELEWIRASPKGRQSKSKARITNYEQLVSDSKRYRSVTPGTIVIPPGPRLGNIVFEVKNLTKTVGDRVLFKDLSFKIPPGATVGIVGPNGAGKTTLINILSGEEQPDSGTVKTGSTVKMAYVSQSRLKQLEPENTIYEEVSGGKDVLLLGDVEMPTRAYLAAFNFRGTSQNRTVEFLSGGERNRVQLAKMLKDGPNVIVLDEPTNDLDVEVLRNLEEALQDFTGVAIIVSHDRWFLDRLCSHIIAFEKDNVVFFEGNYQEYEEDKRKRLGDNSQKTRFLKIEKV